ncbi:MAG: hypothetical protein ACI83B_000800 [Sediminicola sp.]|jgi:hypothetical protein|tara:strand:+ start:4472 stop:5362 length:891 start_codon:yes stop_codon:yes gene_type:complete
MKKKIIFMFLLAITGTFQAQTARVQVIHNSDDAAAEFVGVYLDATLLIADFEFRTAPAFIDAPAELPLDLSVVSRNSSGVKDAIFTATVPLDRGATYAVVAERNITATGYTLPSSFGFEKSAIGREAATSQANTDCIKHHDSIVAPAVETGVINPGVTIVSDNSYTEFQECLELPKDDYLIEVRDETGAVTFASYQAPLATSTLDDAAAVLAASGFLDPTKNSNRMVFGLFAALPSGEALVPLPPTILGIESVDSNSFVLNPNPVNNRLNFELSSLDINELEVRTIDIQVRLVSNT